jgi:hypothetical protein
VTAPPAVVHYLWQADSPTQGARGVCGEQWRARSRAEGCLLEGAPEAVIEVAAPGLGASSLAGCWCRTGEKWRASVGPGGGVEWIPVDTAPAA